MDSRGRPKKYKIVRKDPQIWRFSPRGKAGRPEEIELKIEEFEAFRLSDYEGMNQTEAAKLMRISQQTFSRLLKKARKTLSDALVNGKIIKVQGGCYILSTHQNNQQVQENQVMVQEKEGLTV